MIPIAQTGAGLVLKLMSTIAVDKNDKKTSKFDVSRFKDNYSVAMHDMIKRRTQSKSTKRVSTSDEEDRLPSTEDQPMSYARFEGTIPSKEYGGGTLMLWDRGTWTPQGDAAAGLKSGIKGVRGSKGSE